MHIYKPVIYCLHEIDVLNVLVGIIVRQDFTENVIADVTPHVWNIAVDVPGDMIWTVIMASFDVKIC